VLFSKSLAVEARWARKEGLGGVGRGGRDTVVGGGGGGGGGWGWKSQETGSAQAGGHYTHLA